MKIAVLDDYPNAFRSLTCYARLDEHEVVVLNHAEKDQKKLAAMLDGVDAMILTMQRSPIPQSLVNQLSTVKFISQTGSKFAHIDVLACSKRGITVSVGRPKGQCVQEGASPTAELTWALLLAAMRNLPDEVQRLKSGIYQGSLGRGLYGKTLGIYAYGRLGSAIAKYGRAFDMQVVCWGRDSSLDRAREAGFEVAPSRNAFFAMCDVISLHIPLSKESTGIITALDLDQMKPTSLLVNTSRARLIEDGALARALERGRPGKVAVDVYEDEPVLDGQHPLLHMPNALCTPHLGYVTQDNYEALFGSAVDQILAFAAGQPINVVNPESFSNLDSIRQ